MRRILWTLPLSALGAALAIAPQAAAQTAPPPADPDSILTIQVENDAVSTLKGTSDQYYTSGVRLGWTSPTEWDAGASDLARSVWGDGTTRVSLDLVQSLFTPHNTQIDPPNPSDRPYAGELLLTGGLIHDSATTRDLFDITLGVVGPAALGEEVQNGFHNIIGDTPNRGWHYQIADQPAFELLDQRIWRLALADFGLVQTDVLPSVTAAVGDVRDYVQAGAILRIGQGLASDFGPSRIAPGLSGTDAYLSTQDFAWYAFAGADGQAVGYDVSLDGSTFRKNSASVPRIWDVGEAEAGLAILVAGFRVSYTQTWQTQEFKGARSGLFNFGSLTLSAKF